MDTQLRDDSWGEGEGVLYRKVERLRHGKCERRRAWPHGHAPVLSLPVSLTPSFPDSFTPHRTQARSLALPLLDFPTHTLPHSLAHPLASSLTYRMESGGVVSVLSHVADSRRSWSPCLSLALFLSFALSFTHSLSLCPSLSPLTHKPYPTSRRHIFMHGN